MSFPFRLTLVALLLGGVLAYTLWERDREKPHSAGLPTPSTHESTARFTPRTLPSQPSTSLSPVVPYPATCAEPLQLRIGQVDPQFNLDGATLENALRSAATEWNHATGHTWFTVSNSEGIMVNLLFDGRQEDIEQRKQIEEELDTELALLKERQAEVTSEGLSVQQLITSWNEEKAAYETRVATYNNEVARVDGARNLDRTTLDILEREKSELAILRQRLETSAARMNQAVDLHNEKAREVERAGELLSERIENLRRRFPAQLIKEAEHRRGAFVNEINIYTFTDAENLHFALLHELGHTIGLSHSAVPEAIMAPIRQMGASSTHLTPSDIAAARALCSHP